MATDVDKLSVEELRDSRASWWSQEFDDFLWSSIADVLPGSVLDVGCGIGTLENHLAPRIPPGTKLIGVDIDVRRLGIAAAEASPAGSEASAAYVAGDGRSLPFRDATFSVSLVILTLQHVTDPGTVLSEMRRVTGPGGAVVAVEADNLGQRLYFPFPAPDVDLAMAAFWRRIASVCWPADIAIGPRLPDVFRIAGFASPRVKAHSVCSISWTEPGAFFERARVGIERIARQHHVDRTHECEALIEALGRVGAQNRDAFYAISTVPLFLVVARVPAR